MKRRLEDDLAKLAFGDVSPEVAAKLEQSAQLSPEAVETLAAYRTMRDGLKAMADVPEEQLSKERLREAILSRGMKHEQESGAPVRWTQWLWMPAVACLAGLIVVNLPKSKETAVVALNDPSSFSKMKIDGVSDFKFRENFAVPTPMRSTDAVVSNAPTPTPVISVAPNSVSAKNEMTYTRGSRSRNLSSRHGTREGFLEAAWNQTVQNLMKDGLETKVSFDSNNKPVNSLVRADAKSNKPKPTNGLVADAQSDSTYVVIGTGQDTETGSRPALESTSNDPTSG